MDFFKSLTNVVAYLWEDEHDYRQACGHPTIFEDVQVIDAALDKLDEGQLIIVERDTLEYIIELSHADRLADIRRTVLGLINQKSALTACAPEQE
jgi:hypothetical protein